MRALTPQGQVTPSLFSRPPAAGSRRGRSLTFTQKGPLHTIRGPAGLSAGEEQWREQGYHVSLFFLRLPDADAAIARVAERVKQGGHNIPESVIRRRFDAGLRNFQGPYKSAVDAWALFNNVGEAPLLLEWGENRRP